MLCDRSSGTLYLVYTLGLRIYFVRSTDAAESWSAPVELSGMHCNTAQLALGLEGELYVVWEDYGQRAIVGRKSVDLGVSFGPEFVVVAIHDNVGLMPPNWAGTLSRYATVPLSCMSTPAFIGVAVDTSAGPRRGSVYAVWTEHAVGTVSADPMRWVNEVEPNGSFDTATPIAIGDNFSGLAVSADKPPYYGDVDFFWFDGTAGTTIQITGSVTECLPQGGCYERPYDPALYCENGTALTYVGCGTVHTSEPIPPLIYTLPTTARYYLNAAGSDLGTLYYTYRLREYVLEPGQVARDHRDVMLVRSTDGGATWSEKLRVNDDPPMYDNAIPAVTVDGGGGVHVAWYDRRDEPECGRRVHTYWTWSEDGGITFAPSRRVSEEPSDAGGFDQRRWRVGDHMALHAEGERVHLFWTQVPIGSDPEILAVTITDLPTSIAVPRFAAEAAKDRVVLRWSVGHAREVSGFRIHRAVGDAQAFEPLGEVAVSGGREYQWEDVAVVAGIRYRYRLEVQRGQEASLWEGPVEAAIPSRSGLLRWVEAVPNPFDEVVELRLESPSPGSTRVRVYDVAGHLVTELRPEFRGAEAFVRWNGRNRSGSPVSPGVYLMRAEAGGQHAIRRVIRMR